MADKDLIFPAFIPFFQSMERYNVLVGGRGSGKSSMAALYCVLRAARDGVHVIGMRDRMIRAKESVLKDWMIQLDRIGVPYEFAKSENLITLPHNGASLKAYAFYEASGKATEFKSIRPEPSIVWVEEATNLTLQQFNIVNGILRAGGKVKNRLIMTLNPDTKACFVYKHFEEGDGKAFIHRSTIEDNPHMRNNEAYIEWLDTFPDPELRNAWRNGVWANLSGAIYTYQIVDDLPADAKIRRHGFGQDSGYRDPAAVVEVWDVDEEVPTIYVRQILYERGLTNSDFCGRIQGRVPYDAEILCDSADVKQIEELVRSGWRFARGCYPICKKAKEISVKAMKNYRIKVIHNDDFPATDLIRELDTYRYKNDAAGNPTDKPMDGNDHALDAIRYYTIQDDNTSSMPDAGLIGIYEID